MECETQTKIAGDGSDDPSERVKARAILRFLWVLMDDFIYGEPQAVPEPTSLLLLGTGIAGTAAAFRRRRKLNGAGD